MKKVEQREWLAAVDTRHDGHFVSAAVGTAYVITQGCVSQILTRVVMDGGRQKYWGQCPRSNGEISPSNRGAQWLAPNAGESRRRSEWVGYRVVPSPTDYGVWERRGPETHFGIFWRPQNAAFCTYMPMLWVKIISYHIFAWVKSKNNTSRTQRS